MDEVELNRKIGERIKELRKIRSISQFQLAVECGFENVYYGDVDHPVPGQIDHWVS